jgi:hypothetical protein
MLCEIPVKHLVRTIFLLMMCSAVACAQATVEYGALAGKSAATTSGTASAFNRLNQRLTGSVQQKTSGSTTAPSQHKRVSTPRPKRVASQPAAAASSEPIRVQAAVANQKQSTQAQSKYKSTITVSFDK